MFQCRPVCLASDVHLSLETGSLLPQLLRSQIISDDTDRTLFIEQPALFKIQKSVLQVGDESPGALGGRQVPG